MASPTTRCWILGCCVAAWSAVCPSLAWQEAPSQRPVPSEEAQRAALALISEIYKSEYATAGADTQRAALAKRMLADAALVKDDAAGRYTMTRVARDIAAKAGDWETALQAVEELARGFEIDPLPMQQAVVVVAGQAPLTAESRKGLAVRCRALVGHAIDAQRYEAARELARIALECARASEDSAVMHDASRMTEETVRLADAYAATADARQILAEKPTDADSNLALGRFYCFVRSDWDRGLPMLAQGSDGKLQRIAAAELASPVEAEAQSALADEWWGMAENVEPASRLVMRSRAAHWYRQAAPRLAGLSKKKAEVRIEEAKRETQAAAAVDSLDGIAKWPIVLEGHTGNVNNVVFSADGRFLVSSSSDKAIRLWDLYRGTCVRQFLGHEAPVKGIAFVARDTRLVSVAWDKTVRVWDVASGRELDRFPMDDVMYEVAPIGNTQTVVVTLRNGTAVTFDLDRRSRQRRVLSHGGWVVGAAVSPDGDILATASDGDVKSVQFWNLRTGRPIKTIAPRVGLTGVVFLSGRTLVAASTWRGIHVWNFTTGKDVCLLDGDRELQSIYYDVSSSPDGRLLASSGYDYCVKVWEPVSGRQLHAFEGHQGAVICVTFSPDGAYLASGAGARYDGVAAPPSVPDYSVRVWKLPDEIKSERSR